MKCPVCTTSELLMSERQGVEIDYCPQCRGVWLDRGEIDKIIERSNAVAPPPPPRAPETRPREADRSYPPPRHGHDDHYQHQSGYGHSAKKKSLLNELFDF